MNTILSMGAFMKEMSIILSDDRGNWIRMIKDIRFGNGQENKKQPLIEREIHYSDGMITGICNKSASFPALASISESMIEKIKRYFLRF